MYDVYEIVRIVFLPAAGALMWCILVMFFCMCIERLLFKKQIGPRLTDKELILIKEVLAGHISLPLVANDGLFVECVDRIEHIFAGFITRSRQQTEKLDEIAKGMETFHYNYPALNDHFRDTVTSEGLDNQLKAEELDVSELSFEIPDYLKPKLDKAEKGILLLEPVYKIYDFPKNLRRMLRKKLNCETVEDVLHLMLELGSRKSLMKIYGIGEVYADKLEAFMFSAGLIYLQGYTYRSDYADTPEPGKDQLTTN